MTGPFSRLTYAIVALIVTFNLAPLVVVLGSSVSADAILRFPPTSFSPRWYIEALTSPKWLWSFAFSGFVAACVAVLATAICFLAALVTARRNFLGRGILEIAILVPLALPHAAVALVLLQLASSFGILGSVHGLVLGHVILVIPFSYLLCVAGLRKLDLAYEEAAMTLGATPFLTFRRIVLPLMRTSILGSLLLCFLLSFDEATVALFLRGVTLVTAPVAILMSMLDAANPLVSAISGILIIIGVALLWGIKRVAGLRILVDPARL